MKIAMNLKAKALLATAVVSIGLFVNASPIWAEPQPLTIPSDGIVLQGQAKEKYVADYMKKFFSQMKPPAPFEAPAGWKMETTTVNGITLERMTADQKKSDRVLLQMHGGGYVGGMSNNHRILGLRQATRTREKFTLSITAWRPLMCILRHWKTRWLFTKSCSTVALKGKTLS